MCKIESMRDYRDRNCMLNNQLIINFMKRILSAQNHVIRTSSSMQLFFFSKVSQYLSLNIECHHCKYMMTIFVLTRIRIEKSKTRFEYHQKNLDSIRVSSKKFRFDLNIVKNIVKTCIVNFDSSREIKSRISYCFDSKIKSIFLY